VDSVGGMIFSVKDDNLRGDFIRRLKYVMKDGKQEEIVHSTLVILHTTGYHS